MLGLFVIVLLGIFTLVLLALEFWLGKLLLNILLLPTLELSTLVLLILLPNILVLFVEVVLLFKDGLNILLLEAPCPLLWENMLAKAFVVPPWLFFWKGIPTLEFANWLSGGFGRVTFELLAILGLFWLGKTWDRRSSGV